MISRRNALAFVGAAAMALAVQSACAQPLARPQTPTPPFPYASVEVTFASPADGVMLAGELTLPPNAVPAPAVLLLNVAGPNDRDMSFAGHAAFWVLADRLTRAGFAVLRLDDRGVGGSGGDWTRASYDTLAADALGAIALLRARADIDAARVGVFGLSEGAAIAAMAASRIATPLAFAVLASPPGLSGEASLRSQFEQTLALHGISDAQAAPYRAGFENFISLARAAGEDAAQGAALAAFLAGPGGQLAPPYAFMPRDPAAQAALFAGGWYQSQLALEPAQFYAAVRAPTLVVGGDRDVILPPAQHHEAIRAAAPRADFVVVEGVSHLLQPSETGSPADYARTDVTIDPRVLDLIETWLLARD